MWIRRKTYNNLKKNLYNRGALIRELIIDTAELNEMLDEKDGEVAKLDELLKKACKEIVELKIELSKFGRRRGADGRFISNVKYSNKMNERKYYCNGACGHEVSKYGDKCPACRLRFEDACNTYRSMRGAVANKSHNEQKDAINRFRSGKK